MAIIEIRDVWKRFVHHSARPRTLKEAVVRSLTGRGPNREDDVFWALKGVSLEIEQGETFGIVGSNGSGKSTMLKQITGISRPTRGHVGVRGRVSALLELGAGFHPDFTGRENAFLNGSILGLSRREVQNKFDAIVAFAELEPFIDNPVRTYSSGMYMRLAFSIAIHVDPDILVIDEVLAVGDAAFQQKCYDQIQRFKHAGKTIVFVSHSLQVVKDLCQRSAWLDRGVLRAVGPTDSVIDFYAEQVHEAIERHKEHAPRLLPDERITLRNLDVQDASGRERGVFGFGEAVRFGFDLDATLDLDQFEVAARILRADGTCCYDQRLVLAETAATGQHVRLSLLVPSLRLNQGSYVLSLTVCQRGQEAGIDEKFFNFAVESEHRGLGIAPLEGQWHFDLPLAAEGAPIP